MDAQTHHAAVRVANDAERQEAAKLAASLDAGRLRTMRRRTERRIDRAAPAQRSTVIALRYALLGLLAPLPIVFLLPADLSPLIVALRVGAIPCALLGLIAVAALSSAQRRLLRHYGAHRSWRILARATDLASIKDTQRLP